MTKFKLNKESIAERLVNTYPSSIVCDDRGVLDFESTVENFAECVVDNMSIYQMQMLFGEYFNDTESCRRFLANHIDPIYEYCNSRIEKRKEDFE